MPQHSKRPPTERQSTRKEKSHTKTQHTNEGREQSQGSDAFSRHKTANKVPRISTSSQSQAPGTALLPYSNQEPNTDDMVNDAAENLEYFSLGGTSSNLNTGYKVHHSSEFRLYRVLRMVWAEPRGSGRGNTNPTEITNDGSYEKTRRFVIISVHRGHCICLAISTYTGQGVTKPGVNAKDHAMIYSTQTPPELIGNELERGLKTPGIKINVYSPRDKLDSASRLNFAKVYTIEHNTDVKFIGHVHSSSEMDMMTNVNSIHQWKGSSIESKAASPNDNVYGEKNVAFSGRASFTAPNMQSTPMPPINWPAAQTFQQSSPYYPLSTTSDAPRSFAYANMSQFPQGSSSNSTQPYSTAYGVDRYSQSTATPEASNFGTNYSSTGQNSTASYSTTYHIDTSHTGYYSESSTQGQWQPENQNPGIAYSDSNFSNLNAVVGTGQNFPDQGDATGNSYGNYSSNYHQEDSDNRDR